MAGVVGSSLAVRKLADSWLARQAELAVLSNCGSTLETKCTSKVQLTHAIAVSLNEFSAGAIRSGSATTMVAAHHRDGERRQEVLDLLRKGQGFIQAARELLAGVNALAAISSHSSRGMV